jgi:hypothetical protein
MAKTIKVKSWDNKEQYLTFPKYYQRWSGASITDLKTLAMGDDPEIFEQLNEIQSKLEDLTLRLCTNRFLEKAK